MQKVVFANQVFQLEEEEKQRKKNGRRKTCQTFDYF